MAARIADELWLVTTQAETSLNIDHLRVAATAIRLGAHLLIRNVRHLPMFANVQAPY